MKQEFVLIFALLTACASGGPAIIAPNIIFEQENGPADVNYPNGPIDVKFNMQIENKWTEPITAVRVAMQTLNAPGGAYTLNREFYEISAVIPPGETRIVTFWAKGMSYGRSMRTGEPVSIRAVVYFNTPAGTYQKVVGQELAQNAAW